MGWCSGKMIPFVIRVNVVIPDSPWDFPSQLIEGMDQWRLYESGHGVLRSE